ncbi:Serine/threonine-protein kinase tel1, partial [Cryomyces antarcticus]
MSRTSLDNGILTERSTLQLIPLIKDFWSLKTTSLKDEMLITLVHLKEYIAKMTLSPDAEAFVSDVESLMDVLYTDYSKRSDRDLLQVDELDLVTESDLTARRRALRTAAFCLRTGNLRSESQWMTVYLIAYFASVSDTRKVKARRHVVDVDQPNKRQRGSHNMQHFLRQATHGQSAVRICALQVLAFMLSERALDDEVLHDVL